MRAEPSRSIPDGLIAALIVAGTAWHVASLPHNLGIADESYLLNDARRIASGEVLYRDIFYFTTPLGHWLFAAAFRLFGTTMAVARGTMAVVHGASAATAFLLCRRLGVPRVLGLAVSAATVVLCQPAWPYASLHWLSLLLMLALAWLAVGRWWTEPPRRALWIGALIGGLVAVQQQKGAPIGVGVLALVAGLAAVDWRRGVPRPVAVAVQRALWCACGAAGVVVPLFGFLILQIGVAPLIEQLVVFPFTGYRTFAGTAAWGAVLGFNASLAAYTMPVVLKYQPLVLAVVAARIVTLWLRRPADPRLPALLALLAIGATATLSTLYLADFIHIAFIAPLYFVCWAEVLTAAVAWLVASPTWRHGVLTAAGGALLLGLAVRLEANRTRAWRAFPIAHETAFGRVDFATRGEADLVDRVRGLLAESGSRSFFAYPMYTSLYLTSGADNPTRWQFMVPEYASPAHYDGAIEAIERQRTPYLFACAVYPRDVDSMLRYIESRYEPLDTGHCSLYRRRG